ncbi:hypothetical protein HN011_011214 [Eciton burchellii]|nr:hypothetical protein HN011_011214 [Eciton burchellii]
MVKRRRASGWLRKDCFVPKTPGRLSSLGLTRPASSLPDPVSFRTTYAATLLDWGCFCMGVAVSGHDWWESKGKTRWWIAGRVSVPPILERMSVLTSEEKEGGREQVC